MQQGENLNKSESIEFGNYKQYNSIYFQEKLVKMEWDTLCVNVMK